MPTPTEVQVSPGSNMDSKCPNCRKVHLRGAFPSTRSERPQTRKRNHPRHGEMDTSRVDGVKAPRDAEVALLRIGRAHHKSKLQRLFEQARLDEVVGLRDGGSRGVCARVASLVSLSSASSTACRWGKCVFVRASRRWRGNRRAGPYAIDATLHAVAACQDTDNARSRSCSCRRPRPGALCSGPCISAPCLGSASRRSGRRWDRG